jgi:hypothetical protein
LRPHSGSTQDSAYWEKEKDNRLPYQRLVYLLSHSWDQKAYSCWPDSTAKLLQSLPGPGQNGSGSIPPHHQTCHLTVCSLCILEKLHQNCWRKFYTKCINVTFNVDPVRFFFFRCSQSEVLGKHLFK